MSRDYSGIEASGGYSSEEIKRVEELLRYNILDTPDEEEFDDLTKVAAYLCDVDCAQINFLDHDRQWSKSCYGWDMREIPRDQSICTHTIQQDKYLVINNISEDARFKEYSHLGDKKLQFYAGVVLKSSRGYNIGTLCVFDDKPDELTDQQLESLQILARDVEARLELRLKREQLVEEHKKLKKTATFLHNSADLLLIVDHTLQIEEVNEKAEVLLGYSRNTVVGGQLTDFIEDDEFQKQFANWKSARSPERFSSEYVFKTAKDEKLWFRISITEEFDKYFVTAREVTDRKRVEQNLRKQQQFTGDIIRHLPGIFFLLDEDSRIQKWNNNLEEVDKRTEQSVIGQSYDKFIAEEDQQAAVKALQKAFTEGYVRTELNFLAKSGEAVPLLLSGFRYQANGINYVTGIGVNISEEKRARKELRRKEQKLKQAQHIAKMGSWSWHIPDDNLQWSDEIYQILGLDKGEVQPSVDVFLDMMCKNDRKKVEKNIERIMEGKEMKDVEHQMKRSDGSIVYVHERGEVHRNSEGHPIEVSGTMQDVTARREAEEKIKSALKEKEILLSEVHHRVKNNLAIINSLLQLEKFKTNDKQLENIISQSQMRIRSMALIHERLYASGDFANISLGDYFEELIESIFETVTLDTQNIDLEMRTEQLNLTINQSIPCGLIVNELVTNSLKHAFPSSETGTVRFSLEERNGEVYLSVSDDGIGIGNDLDLKKLDTMGLTLVRTLVNQLQGDLEVKGENGTTFTITFQKRKAKGSSANVFLREE